MKKMIMTAILAISTVGLFAQTSGGGLTSKKGEMYLPESGDWAISFDASPFLNYFGNMLSSAGNKAPTANFLNNNGTIIGKYFVDDQTAYRALVRIGIDHWGMDNLVTQDNYTGSGVAPQVTDHASLSTHFIGLGAGMEKRRGKTRLQGYYGAEFMFFLSGTSSSYTYGNAFSSSDVAPTSTQWSVTPSTISVTGVGPATTGRTTEFDYGSTFGINLQGFIGFEYFFCPKISVGGEYTWGITFTSTGQGTQTTEFWTTSDQSNTAHTGGGSSFGFDSGINTAWGNAMSAFGAGAGDLYINFHF